MTSWTLSEVLIVPCAFLSLSASVAAQTQTPAAPPSASDRAAIAAASRAERDRELKLLGISDMQPGTTA
jgi:hypothetical protein